MSREAMQQALDALRYYRNTLEDDQETIASVAIDALRAALSEEAMQRLTDVQQEMERKLNDKIKKDIAAVDFGVPEEFAENAENYAKWYTSEREWVGLTIGELSALYDKHAKCQEEGMLVSGWLDFAAEHDALLKEKNT